MAQVKETTIKAADIVKKGIATPVKPTGTNKTPTQLIKTPVKVVYPAPTGSYPSQTNGQYTTAQGTFEGSGGNNGIVMNQRKEVIGNAIPGSSSYPSQYNGLYPQGYKVTPDINNPVPGAGIIGPEYGRAPVPGGVVLPDTGDGGGGGSIRTNEEVDAAIKAILTGSTGIDTSINALRPTLRSGEDMAKQLGVNYNLDFITKLLTDAAMKKSENLDLDAAKGQNAFYKSMSDNANLLAQQAVKGDRAAAMSGISEAGRAANELSMMLGTGAEASKGATQLAVDRALLKAKGEADVMDAKAKGLADYNSLGVELGRVGASELNAGMVGYNGELSLTGSKYGADSAIKQALIALEGQKYAADRGVAAAAAGKSSGSSYGTTKSASELAQEAVTQEIANLTAIVNSSATPAAKKAAEARLLQLSKLRLDTTVTPTKEVYVQNKDR